MPAASTEPSSRGGFDVIVSCEMLEHMKNYDMVLAKVSSWLTPDGADDGADPRQPALRLRLQDHRLDGQVLLRRRHHAQPGPVRALPARRPQQSQVWDVNGRQYSQDPRRLAGTPRRQQGRMPAGAGRRPDVSVGGAGALADVPAVLLGGLRLPRRQRSGWCSTTCSRRRRHRVLPDRHRLLRFGRPRAAPPSSTRHPPRRRPSGSRAPVPDRHGARAPAARWCQARL